MANLELTDLSLEELRLIDDLSLEAALLPYPFYTRRFTLFKRNYLESPILHDLSLLTVPKFSTYHYMELNGLSNGPRYADPLLMAAPGRKFIVHMTTLHKPESTPIKIPGANIQMSVTEYRRTNRMVRPIVDTRPVENDDRGLLIYNYAMLATTWRYPANFRADYFKWANIYRTLCNNLATVVQSSTRNQYIDMPLPDRIPSLAKLREYSRTKSTESMKYLREPGDFTLADLFVWCGEKRENSFLAMIDEAHYSKVNFILIKNNGWVVLNLGWLNALRESGAYPPRLLEVKLLMMMNKIATIANSYVAVPEHPMDDTDVIEELDDDEAARKEDDSAKAHADDLADVLSSGFVDDLDTDGGLLDDVAELTKTEKELEALDIARETAQMDYIDDEINPDTQRFNVDGFIHGSGEEKGIVAKADELLERNNITPAAYKRLLRISERYDSLPDPYGGDKLLKDAQVLDEEDFVLQPEEFIDTNVVMDKAMQVSRVDTYQRRYIKDVYKKDLMAAITAMQKFPVAITDYKVIDKSDAMSNIEEHVIKVVPAVGESSVLRIPVFKIDDDGTFLYSGTRYKMRMQRSD